MGKSDSKDALALMEEALRKMNDSVDELRGVVVALKEGDMTIKAVERRQIKDDAADARALIQGEASTAKEKIQDEAVEARHMLKQEADDLKKDLSE